MFGFERGASCNAIASSNSPRLHPTVVSETEAHYRLLEAHIPPYLLLVARDVEVRWIRGWTRSDSETMRGQL